MNRARRGSIRLWRRTGALMHGGKMGARREGILGSGSRGTRGAVSVPPTMYSHMMKCFQQKNGVTRCLLCSGLNNVGGRQSAPLTETMYYTSTRRASSRYAGETRTRKPPQRRMGEEFLCATPAHVHSDHAAFCRAWRVANAAVVMGTACALQAPLAPSAGAAPLCSETKPPPGGT